MEELEASYGDRITDYNQLGYFILYNSSGGQKSKISFLDQDQGVLWPCCPRRYHWKSYFFIFQPCE